MGIVEQARLDIQQILGNSNDFGVSLTLFAPTSPVTELTIVGTIKKHHTVFDELGVPTRSKANTVNASCTVSMLTLDENNYPYLNANHRADFKGHKVSWADSTGNTIMYVVEQWFPDYQTGSVSFELTYYGTN
jgi:hypothetical protein